MVITELKMPGASGLDVLRETKHADGAIPVLLLTAYGSVEEAVAAMKEGAFDFLQKPVDLEHLKLLVKRAAQQQELLRENLLLREEYSTRYGFPRIVGEHPSIREMSQQIQKVAATDSTCLLLGESGTGKELFALAIHHLSPRREQAFVALNCAAIPEGLVENELFGHEKGAFTGVEARDRLLHYRWPGNVRELQNTLERAVILANGTSIRADGLQLPAAKPDAERLPAGMLPEKFNWEGSLEEVTGRAASHVEKVMLENTMRECKWNKTRAAEKLGVSPKTLLAKLRGAGLEE